ncbi:transcriptional regulator [Beggiatoa sp. SS]|nr:transcriptional regulator [Beggiatoa sp. SS]
MASRPYKAAHYLNDPADRAAYLNEVLETGDFNGFLLALKNLAETSEMDSERHILDEFNAENVNSPNLIRLNSFLHDLGLRLSIGVFQPVNPI